MLRVQLLSSSNVRDNITAVPSATLSHSSPSKVFQRVMDKARLSHYTSPGWAISNAKCVQCRRSTWGNVAFDVLYPARLVEGMCQ